MDSEHELEAQMERYLQEHAHVPPSEWGAVRVGDVVQINDSPPQSSSFIGHVGVVIAIPSIKARKSDGTWAIENHEQSLDVLLSRDARHLKGNVPFVYQHEVTVLGHVAHGMSHIPDEYPQVPL